MKKSKVLETLAEMKKISDKMKRMNEAYIFDDEDPTMGQEMGQPMQQPQQGEGESEEEKQMHAQEIIQHEPIIAKIREIAIEGLKKYSDHPTSPIYDFFKKTFLEADKVITDGASK